MYDHLAVPGPDYWAWKCRVCGELVDNHPGLIRWLWHRVTKGVW